MTAEHDRPTREKRDKPLVLIAGGGIAGLETVLALRALAGDRVDIEVLTPSTTLHYRPLDVGRPFGCGGTRHYDIEGLVRSAGARFRLGTLASVDVERKSIATAEGRLLFYDALVVACGVRSAPAFTGALSFRGEQDIAGFEQLLSRLGKKDETLAFVQPASTSWTLPLYELALMTAGDLAARPGRKHTDVVVVTPEEAPLALFGADASKALSVLLQREGVEVYTNLQVVGYSDGILQLSPHGELQADHVVSMPVLHGPAIAGLPSDEAGFIPTDAHGRVLGIQDVYAAGDVTTYPVKQGGIASQEADLVAETLAAWAGAPVEPTPLRPILRAQLLTAGAPRYLEIELGGTGQVSKVAFDAPEGPPGKITARYLGPALAARGGAEPPPVTRSPGQD